MQITRPTAFSIFTFLLIAIGICFRLYHITDNSFTFYDEGLYLSQNRSFNEWFAFNFKIHPNRFFTMMQKSLYLGLGTGKMLWYVLSDMRSLFLGADAWYFPRVLAATFGILSFWLVYLFAKKYFQSRAIGVICAAVLALYPSHIFYSRLALQETLTGLFFLAGMYFYFSSKKLHVRTFLAGIFFACTFYTSYRMIILPVFVGFCELFYSITHKEKFNLRRLLWSMLTFLLLVFVIGNIAEARNTKVTFAWMFYQGHLAKDKFEFLNLLSYPYYLFRLESIFFGCLFFGNIYYIIRKQWARLLPFALSIVYMVVFTLPQDKATRYICAIMPFIAMAVGVLIYDLYQHRQKWLKVLSVIFVVLMIGVHTVKANTIALFRNDYQTSIQDLLAKNPNAKVLASQYNIQKLYVTKPDNVFKLPFNTTNFIVLYSRGYEYLIVGPQIYVSHTHDKRRFHQKLKGYLNFVIPYATPLKTYDHFAPDMLERFVLEHNENLRQSLEFLAANKDGQLGQLRVYSIKHVLLEMQGRINAHKRFSNKNN